jgi:hypothetical protein
MDSFNRRSFELWRASRFVQNITIVLISVMVILVMSEFTIRRIFHGVTTTGDNRSYFAQRWMQTVRRNRWGFREREFDLSKPTAVYRIAVIGDSITFGQGIQEKDRFTNLLEQRLSTDNNRYEVLNFGRPGAETVDHLSFLESPALSAEPDFILLQWYVNDVEGHDKRERPRPLPLLPSDFLMRTLRGTSALFYFLDTEWSTIQRKLGWVRSYEEYMLARFGDPYSVASIEAQEALQHFVRRCKEHHVSVGAVLFSDMYFSESPFDFLIERAVRVCQQEAITCIDLRSSLGRYRGDRTVWASRLDPHPGPRLHRLVADQLISTFGPVWLRGPERVAAPIGYPKGAGSAPSLASTMPARLEPRLSSPQIPDSSPPKAFQ